MDFNLYIPSRVTNLGDLLMRSSKIKIYSLIGSLALGAFFMFTTSQQAVAQTDNSSTDNASKDISFVSKNIGIGADASKAIRKGAPVKPLPAPTTSNWTGFYVGGYVGAGWNRATADTTTVYSPTGYFATTSVPAINTTGHRQIKPKSFTGGGTVGYNYQTGNWVIGAEADFGASTGSQTVSGTTIYPCCSPTAFTISQSLKTRWLFTARPRFGYAYGKALFYVTGGLSLTDLNYQAIFTDTFATAKENGGVKKTKAGWNGGGGVEYDLGNKWSLKGEYLYSSFGRVTATSTNLTAFSPSQSFPTNVFTHSIYLKENALRFGVNYRF